MKLPAYDCLVRGAGAALAWLLAGCSGEAPPGSMAAPAREVLFASYCVPCHEPGEGFVSFAPPFTGSPWVAGPESRLIRIVLHGLRGPIEAGGKTYNLEMPGFGKVLGDEQVAGLLTHLRARDLPGSAPITPETVARVRAEARDRTACWTVAELLERR